MKSAHASDRSLLILAMVIFGTVGIFRKYIPAPSSVVALVRGVTGTVFLVCYLLAARKKMDWPAVKRSMPALLYSGAAIGFNWILLFEAYSYTSVATATLCYYLAPILVILFAPLVVKEKLTVKKFLCAGAALLGMVFVSGVLETDFGGIQELKGILFGVGAAVLYASVILTNKKMPPIPALDKTVFQLLFASIALLPYVLMTEDAAGISMSGFSMFMLLTMGILHTGLAYLLYFRSMGSLQAHTVALLSYIDPVLAIILSALLLREPMTVSGAVGAVLILGAAYLSEKE